MSIINRYREFNIGISLAGDYYAEHITQDFNLVGFCNWERLKAYIDTNTKWF